jgi:hypothetical protein
MKILFIFLLICLFGQTGSDFYKNLKWCTIGPANMTGRVSDVEALDNSFQTVLVAAASGKYTNAGTTYQETCKITLNADGKTLTGIITIRQDPLLDINK